MAYNPRLTSRHGEEIIMRSGTRKIMRQLAIIVSCLIPLSSAAQSNPLWTQQKVRNYLPHMTAPEVETLLTRTDMVIIPVGSLEQHGNHLPIGTDFINGVERCKLIAQERDILVAPVLMVGQSPYHMGFAGTITLSAETIIQVHLEAVESLIEHHRCIHRNTVLASAQLITQRRGEAGRG